MVPRPLRNRIWKAWLDKDDAEHQRLTAEALRAVDAELAKEKSAHG